MTHDNRTEFMDWIDEKIQSDADLERMVNEQLAAMRLEQAIVRLRAKRQLTQTELAKRMGVSQPMIAKLESGRIQNLHVKTLLKAATALEADLEIRFRPRRRVQQAR